MRNAICAARTHSPPTVSLLPTLALLVTVLLAVMALAACGSGEAPTARPTATETQSVESTLEATDEATREQPTAESEEQPREAGGATPKLDESEAWDGKYISISAGARHSCGVKSDLTVACWGENEDGEATPPEGEFASVGLGTASSCAVRTDGTVACWGWNKYSQAMPPEGSRLRERQRTYTCGVRSDGSVEPFEREQSRCSCPLNFLRQVQSLPRT